jgi:hypothetical protein
MKILIFIDHDIIIRHFLHSGVFRPLESAHDVRFVFPLETPKPRRVTIDLDTLGLDNKLTRLPLVQERLSLWNKLIHVNNLRWRPNAFSKNRRAFTRHVIGPGHVREYVRLALPGVYSAFRWHTLRRLDRHPHTPLRHLLEREKPHLLIHPTVMSGYFINDLTQLSKQLGIPLVAIMNSWDNPSTKKAMDGHPDLLLVWGRQTAEHAHRFARMPRRNILPFGAAQFEVYREPPSLDSAAYRKRHGLPADRRLLLYAGSSKGTDEFSHLSLLEDAAEQGRLPNVTILYRPHPWGDCGRDGWRIGTRPWKHVVIEATMADYVHRVTNKTPLGITTPDYRNTRDCLANVDAVISPLSTILVEAALLGKPCLCLLPDEELDASHYHLVRDMVHFGEFFSMPEFLLAKGATELVGRSCAALERASDPAFAVELRKAAEYFVQPFEQPFGERLLSLAESLVPRP